MYVKEPDLDLWADILNDVSTATTNRDKKCLLILGDDYVGKTTLINRLRRAEGGVSKPGLGVEYSYLDIRDQFSDDIISRLSLWTLNGDRSFLKYTLSNRHISYSDKGWHGMVVLVVDYSKPWCVMERLSHWVGVLEKHIAGLKIDGADQRDSCNKLTRSLQEYCIPGSEGNKDVLLPLTEGVLENNLGIPIVVVCTKVDGMTSLEKDLDYTDSHFDLIQWHLRKFCLKYGAGLVYVNGKESPNSDFLYKYIVHKMYNHTFEIPPSVIDKDSLLIPAGWDTLQKIGILNDTLRAFKLEDSLDTVLPKPLNRRTETVREVKAEDDQAFLTRMQSLLQNQRPVGPRPAKPLTSAPTRGTSLPTGTSPTPGGPGEKDGVLANFFNSLLNKKPTSPGVGTGAPRPGTAGAGPRPGTISGAGPRTGASPATPTRQPTRGRTQGDARQT